MSSKEILDRVQTLASIEALEPPTYATALTAELPPIATLAELEARDAQISAALRCIDELATRVMRLRLEHALALANDSSLGAPTRKVFAATVLDYADDLTRLADRVRDIAARGGNPDAIASVVVDAARATLATRDQLRAGVLAVIGDLSTAMIPDADRHAKDRTLPDAQRRQWSAARRDLEILAADPARILAAAWAARIAAWPEQIDEPPAEAERTFADMIEID